MGALIKRPITTYIPGNPGNPGSPYVPPTAPSIAVVPVTACAPAGDPVIRVVTVYPGESLFDKLGISSDGATGVQILGMSSVDANLDGKPEYTRFTVQLSASDAICTTTNQIVTTPGTAAIPAVPYSPPTPAQISVSMNEGWNSYARSVDAIPPGSLVEFSVKLGTHGALVALGAPGMEGALIDTFAHGVMADSSGIYVFESGAVVSQLAASNPPGTVVRIQRLADGRVVYVCGSVVAISAEPTSVFDTLYVYGMLYAAYDEVTSTEIMVGASLAEPSVVMAGAGEITMAPEARTLMAGYGDFLVSVNGPAALMAGAGDLIATLSQAAEIPTTAMSGVGAVTATLEAGGRGYVTLEAMQAFGSDSASTTYGIGSTSLPLFTVSASGGSFIPAQPTNGYVNLPFIVAWGEGVEISAGNGNTSLPLLVAQASEGDYGIGSAELPLMAAFGYGGFLADDAMELFSVGVTQSSHAQAVDLVLLLSSDGSLTSSFEMTRTQALALLSVLQQNSSFALLGVYGLGLLAGARAGSLVTMNPNGQADLYSDGAVWVVNLDTSASAQYANYGFNSFFRRGDDHYGVANDGIYKLSGDTDAGSPIEALIEFANTNLGSTQAKRMSDVYLASSGNALVLKVVTPGRTNYYTARWGGDGMQNQRVNPGKGLQSVYWQFGMLNQDGDDFELAGLEFLPIVTQRRVI